MNVSLFDKLPDEIFEKIRVCRYYEFNMKQENLKCFVINHINLVKYLIEDKKLYLNLLLLNFIIILAMEKTFI